MGVRTILLIQILDLLVTVVLTLFLFSKVSGYKFTFIDFLVCFVIRFGVSIAFVVIDSFVDIELLYYLSFPIYMVLISFILLKSVTYTVVIFFGLFSITLWNLFYRSIAFFVLPAMGVNSQFLDNALWGTVIDFISTIFVLLFLKLLQYDFLQLRSKNIDYRDKKILYLTNWMMVVYYATIQLLTYLEYERQIDTLPYRELVVLVYFVLFMVLRVFA